MNKLPRSPAEHDPVRETRQAAEQGYPWQQPAGAAHQWPPDIHKQRGLRHQTGFTRVVTADMMLLIC